MEGTGVGRASLLKGGPSLTRKHVEVGGQEIRRDVGGFRLALGRTCL